MKRSRVYCHHPECGVNVGWAGRGSPNSLAQGVAEQDLPQKSVQISPQPHRSDRRLKPAGANGETQCGCDPVPFVTLFYESYVSVIRRVASVVGNGRACRIAVQLYGKRRTKLGAGSAMAKLIEFHVPDNFRSPKLRTPTEEQRGRVIEFRPRPVKQGGTNPGVRPSPLTVQAGSALDLPFRWP